MRTTTSAARGKPLAVALLFLLLACTSGVVLGEGSLQVEQTLSPAQINVAGVGTKPDSAAIDVSLIGQGGIDKYPLDCVVVIDVSASSQLDSVKQFAYDFIGRLGDEDRVAVVSFGTVARLDVPLTWDKAGAKTAISNLAQDNKSALGAGLQLARGELVNYGRDEAVLAIVLIADGQNDVGQAPTVEGIVTGDVGIRMISVGVTPVINRALLKGLADQSDGLFIQDLSSDGVDTIADALDITAAATDIVVTKHIPLGLNFVGSTPGASQVRTERDGSTTATWQIAKVGLGQVVQIQASFDAAAKGNLATDDLSTVSYRDFRGVVRQASISPLVLSVIMPNRAPIAAFSVDPAAPSAGETVTFHDQSRDMDDGDRVVAWQWSFGDGATSSDAKPQHVYSTHGTYSVTLQATDSHGAQSDPATRTITVANGKPVPNIVLREPDTLRALTSALVGAEVLLDASGSTDIDGSIVSYGWDLDNDGVIDQTSSAPTLTASFPAEGNSTVGLTVTDNSGNSVHTTVTFPVVTSLTTDRTIDTYLPSDQTIPGAVVRITLTITANASLDGMAVSETLPTGWTFRSVEADGATVRTTATSAEWIFAEKLLGGTQDAVRQIQYELTAPSTTPTDEQNFITLKGTVSSSSPRMSQSISGEDKITLLKSLPIPVAISHWNVATSAVELKSGFGDTIAFDQIQYAVSLWVSGSVVPRTNNGTIDLTTLEDLIAYWLTGSSVYDPLP